MLNEYRKEIEEIDKEISKLFIRRMNVVSKVKEYKQINDLPVLDKNREEVLFNELSSKYNDDKTLKYYQKLILKVF